jgi:3-phosphoshikimate 1-carboxyvinyltransferase
MPDHLTLTPISQVQGEVYLPGSKSISNRLLLLAALAEGRTIIDNLLVSDDTTHMVNALRQLGVKLTVAAETHQVQVEGLAGPFPRQKQRLFLGNAGTVMRPLCAALCLGEGEFTLIGEPRMYQRPIADLVNALQQLGAHIEYLQTAGYPPLTIQAAGLTGGQVQLKGNLSSQYLSSLLMVAPLVNGPLTINLDTELVSKPYVDITLKLMDQFGVKLAQDHYRRFSIKADQHYLSPGSVTVEGDASSASYFLAAGAIAGGPVRVYGLGQTSIQGDLQFAEVLAQMGAKVTYSDHWLEVAGEGQLHGADLDLNAMPDAAMTLAVVALFAKGTTRLRNIYNWRLKETDRLTAVATELRKLGAEVIEQQDSLTITPPTLLKNATIDTYQDHRMAMSFSLAALSSATITINNPSCVSKTYPEYFTELQRISKSL